MYEKLLLLQSKALQASLWTLKRSYGSGKKLNKSLVARRTVVPVP